jgi:hypothetical protein
VRIVINPTLWPLRQYADMMRPPPARALVACPLCGEPLDKRADGIKHCPRGDWQSDPLFPVGARRSWGGY